MNLTNLAIGETVVIADNSVGDRVVEKLKEGIKKYGIGKGWRITYDPAPKGDSVDFEKGKPKQPGSKWIYFNVYVDPNKVLEVMIKGMEWGSDGKPQVYLKKKIMGLQWDKIKPLIK